MSLLSPRSTSHYLFSQTLYECLALVSDTYVVPLDNDNITFITGICACAWYILLLFSPMPLPSLQLLLLSLFNKGFVSISSFSSLFSCPSFHFLSILPCSPPSLNIVFPFLISLLHILVLIYALSVSRQRNSVAFKHVRLIYFTQECGLKVHPFTKKYLKLILL